VLLRPGTVTHRRVVSPVTPEVHVFRTSEVSKEMRTRIMAAVAVALALCLVPGTALAAAGRGSTAEIEPLISKNVPDIIARARHADTVPTGAGSFLNSGTNKVEFSKFDSGDIIVITDPASITGHAGLFDASAYVNISSYAIISANVTPRNGVQREQCIKFRASDRAYGLWVPAFYSHRVQARNFAEAQMGKPYSLLCSKTDLRSFYCSKVAWAAWHFTAGVDLDGDGGYWVWPIDLVTSHNTRIFGLWT
jgi:uncharacterized protein YycO